ncbi:alginate export family protein [Marinobacter xestospongiae]|uniref:Alginate export family protein n=1 Tax=Marinobacter xestospongiae TaxID=994319 RepID=A0ABU3VX21_9GAMM|nr:alginate export family protein [Marinobacter xestospongiae]MDV2078791.1 alginate export family protein [Marinobacter xestospongiae]
MSRRHCRSVGLLLLLLTLPALVRGAANTLITEQPRYQLQHKLTAQLGHGPGDAPLGSDSRGFGQLRYQPALTAYLPQRAWPDWQVHTRLWLTYSDEDSNSALFEGTSPEGDSLELRDAYLRRERLLDDPRLSLTVGRQPYRSPLALWWDTSLTSARLQWQDTFERGFIALGQRPHSFNSVEGRLDPEDRDIGYLLSEYARRWAPQGWAGVRLVAELDHSGADWRNDREDIRAVRSGVFIGERQRADQALVSDYHVEALWLQGQRQDASGQDSIRGWALAGEVGKRFRQQPWQPRLAVRAVITDNRAHGFYLNGLQSDRIQVEPRERGALAGSLVSLSLRNTLFYGLRLEAHPATRQRLAIMLSNLHCRSASGPLPVERTGDGNDRCQGHDLGQTLDLDYRWRMFPLAIAGSQLNWQVSASLGLFHAGSALAVGGDDQQWLLSTELSW